MERDLRGTTSPTWTKGLAVVLMSLASACFIQTAFCSNSDSNEVEGDRGLASLLASTIQSRCEGDDAAALVSSAVDVRADGALLWPAWPASELASELGYSDQTAQALLLNHTGIRNGGGFQVSALVQMYASAAQAPLNVTMVTPEWWDAEALSLAGHTPNLVNLSSYAAWALAPSALSSLYAGNLLQPLDKLLPLSPELSAIWQDTPQVFREASAVYDGNIVGIPYTTEVPVLFWRSDLFRKQGVSSAPSTWSETVLLAQQLNGSQVPCLSNTSTTCSLHGFCFGLPTGCFYDGLALTAIWASMVGAYGTRGGLFFDPVKVQGNLMAGPAMEEALRIYTALSDLGPRYPTPCGRYAEGYYVERCAIGLSLTSMFKVVGYNYRGVARVELGVSLLPGSERVLNRGTGRLEDCTPTTCPFATGSPSLFTNRTLLVNRVPYLGRGAFSLGINRAAPPNHALAALRSFAYALSYEDGWPSVLDPTTRTAPVRATHLSPANVERWVAVGYDRNITLRFMRVMSESLQHPCMAVGLRIAGSGEIDNAFAKAAIAAVYDRSAPATILMNISTRVAHMVEDHYGGDVRLLQEAYWDDIGYRQAIGAPPSSGNSSGGSAGSASRLSLAVALSCAASAVVVIVVLARMAIKRRRAWQASLWPVEAPGYSPDTSLCITDIQSSTALWEVMEAQVMDYALSLHNTCIRGLLPKHNGYECHTEGDSFIIAFPSAPNAVAFSLEMQVELMHLPWPEELLLHEHCAVVYHTASAAAPTGGGMTGTAAVEGGGTLSSSFSHTQVATPASPALSLQPVPSAAQVAMLAPQPPASPLQLLLRPPSQLAGRPLSQPQMLPEDNVAEASSQCNQTGSLADVALSASFAPASELAGSLLCGSFAGPDLAGHTTAQATAVARSPFSPVPKPAQPQAPACLTVPSPGPSKHPTGRVLGHAPSSVFASLRLSSSRWGGAIAAAAGRAAHTSALTSALPGLLHAGPSQAALAPATHSGMGTSGAFATAGVAGGGELRALQALMKRQTGVGMLPLHSNRMMLHMAWDGEQPPPPPPPQQQLLAVQAPNCGESWGNHRFRGLDGSAGGAAPTPGTYDPGLSRLPSGGTTRSLLGRGQRAGGGRLRALGALSRTSTPHGPEQSGPGLGSGPGQDAADSTHDQEHDHDGTTTDGGRSSAAAAGSTAGSGPCLSPRGHGGSDGGWRPVAAHLAEARSQELRGLLPSRVPSRLSNETGGAAALATAASAEADRNLVSPSLSPRGSCGLSGLQPQLQLQAQPQSRVPGRAGGVSGGGDAALEAAVLAALEAPEQGAAAADRAWTNGGGGGGGLSPAPSVGQQTPGLSAVGSGQGQALSMAPQHLSSGERGSPAPRCVASLALTTVHLVPSHLAVPLGSPPSPSPAALQLTPVGGRGCEGALTLPDVPEEEDAPLSFGDGEALMEAYPGREVADILEDIAEEGALARAEDGPLLRRCGDAPGSPISAALTGEIAMTPSKPGSGHRSEGGSGGGGLAEPGALQEDSAARRQDARWPGVLRTRRSAGRVAAMPPPPVFSTSRASAPQLPADEVAALRQAARVSRSITGVAAFGGAEAPAADAVAWSPGGPSTASVSGPGPGAAAHVAPGSPSPGVSPVRGGGSASSLQRSLFAWSLTGRCLRPQARHAARLEVGQRGASFSLDDRSSTARLGGAAALRPPPPLMASPRLPASVVQLAARLAAERSVFSCSPDTSRSPSRLAMRWPRGSKASSSPGTATATNTGTATGVTGSADGSGNELPARSSTSVAEGASNRTSNPSRALSGLALGPSPSAPLPLPPGARGHSRLGIPVAFPQGAVGRSSGSISLGLQGGMTRQPDAAAPAGNSLAGASSGRPGSARRPPLPAPAAFAAALSATTAAMASSSSLGGASAAAAARGDSGIDDGGGDDDGGGGGGGGGDGMVPTQPSRRALGVGTAVGAAIASGALAASPASRVDSFTSSVSTALKRPRQRTTNNRLSISDWVAGMLSAAGNGGGGSGATSGCGGGGGGGSAGGATQRSIGGFASLRSAHNAGTAGVGVPGHSAHTPGLLCFRGFRVRVGVCSGLLPGRDVVYCKDLSRRMAYSGVCMQVTKLVSDAAVGGMVLLAAPTVHRLLPLPQRDLPGLVVWHKGRFELAEKGGAGPSRHGRCAPPSGAALPAPLLLQPAPAAAHAQSPVSGRGAVGDLHYHGDQRAHDLYQALVAPLAARQLLLERLPLRAKDQVLPGVLAAPLATVTLAMVQVVGLSTLLAWDAGVTHEALSLLQSATLELLKVAGGYPASVDGGLILAAFKSAPEAVRWLLSLEGHLRMNVPWPEELLEHELGDALVISVPTVTPRVSQRRASVNGGGVPTGGGGGGGGSSNTLPVVAAGSATSGRPDPAPWLLFGGGGGGVGSVGASFVSAASSALRRRVSIGGGGGGGSQNMPRYSRTRTSFSHRGGGGVGGSGGGAPRPTDCGCSSEVLTKVSLRERSRRASVRAFDGPSSMPLSVVAAAAARHGAPAAAAAAAAAADDLHPLTCPSLSYHSQPLPLLPSSLAAGPAMAPPSPGSPAEQPLVYVGAAAPPAQGAAQEAAQQPRAAPALPAHEPSARARTVHLSGLYRQHSFAVAQAAAAAVVADSTGAATEAGSGAAARDSTGALTALAAGSAAVGAAAANSGFHAVTPAADADPSGQDSDALLPRDAMVVRMGRRSISERLSPLRAGLAVEQQPRPTETALAALPAGATIIRGCTVPHLRTHAGFVSQGLDVYPNAPRTQQQPQQHHDPISVGSGAAALAAHDPAAAGLCPPPDGGGPMRRKLAPPAAAPPAGGAQPLSSPLPPPYQSQALSGELPPLSLTPLGLPHWSHSAAQHAPHGAAQQQVVLRGLRVRCAAVEGVFAQDGSVDAARLYRGQNGGRIYSKLSRLCCHALMGQVLCSWTVAKRINRAAAAGDAAAQQLRLTPLPGGSGKRVAMAAASGGGEADALAAAAAAAGTLASEDGFAEGITLSRAHAIPGLSKSEMWVCSWARGAGLEHAHSQGQG